MEVLGNEAVCIIQEKGEGGRVLLLHFYYNSLPFSSWLETMTKSLTSELTAMSKTQLF